MRLSAPSFSVFLVSVLIAVFVFASKYGWVYIPFFSTQQFWGLAIAYVILLAGTIFRRL